MRTKKTIAGDWTINAVYNDGGGVSFGIAEYSGRHPLRPRIEFGSMVVGVDVFLSSNTMHGSRLHYGLRAGRSMSGLLEAVIAATELKKNVETVGDMRAAIDDFMRDPIPASASYLAPGVAPEPTTEVRFDEQYGEEFEKWRH